MTHVADLLSRVKSVRKNGSGWVSQCPAHDDTTPSLSITETADRVLLHCHAGCKTESITQKIGLNMRDLFTDNKPARIPAAPTTHPQLGTPTVSYRYSDTFTIMRWDTATDKTFRPLTYDGCTWSWVAPPEPRPLYNAERLRAGVPVLVVEGEKCADAASKVLGDDVFVVTWSGGADAVKKTDFSALRGRDVVLWPDRDNPGAEAMQHVSAILAGKAKTIRMVHPGPGADCPKGWDVADLIQDNPKDPGAIVRQFIERAELVESAYQSDVFIPTWENEPPEIPAVISIGESTLLTAGNVAGIIAAAGTGKSAVCEVLAVSRINPTVDTFGLTVNTEKIVCYLDTERTTRDHWRSWARAMRRAGVAKGCIADTVTFELIGMISDVEERRKHLYSLVESERFGLLVVDGLADFVLDTNDLKECNPFLNELLALCKKHETAILTTIHSNPQKEAEKARGHLGSELMRRAESVMMIKHDRPTGIRSLTMNFTHGKNRNDSDNLECHFAWNDDADMFTTSEPPPDPKDKGAKAAGLIDHDMKTITEIIEKAGEITVRKLEAACKNVGVPVYRCRKARDFMVCGNLLSEKLGANNSKVYSLNESGVL
jgi:archaellum biogenesis ATPase FlaH